jgi:hypothetical protein
VYKRNYVVRGYELNREDDSVDFDLARELASAIGPHVWPGWRDSATSRSGIDEQKLLIASRTRGLRHR